MKKSIIIVLLAILAIPSSSLFAETATTTQPAPTRQNILKERLEQQRKNYLQNLGEARKIAEEYRSAGTPEERRELRDKARNGFMVRLTNAAERLSEMQERVSARITMAEEKGFDVTKAQEQLELSQNYLTIVLDAQENLKEVLTNDDEEDDVTKEEARAIFETIKENFKLARQSLIASIQALKDSVTSSDDEENDEEADEEESEDEENDEVEDETTNDEETQ